MILGSCSTTLPDLKILKRSSLHEATVQAENYIPTTYMVTCQTMAIMPDDSMRSLVETVRKNYKRSNMCRLRHNALVELLIARHLGPDSAEEK